MTKEIRNPSDEGIGCLPAWNLVLRHWSFVIRHFFGALLILPGIAASQTTSTENNLKAVYLFHFAQFVEWPSGAFATPESPLVIGILGQDYLSSAVEEAVAGESVRGRKLVVKRCGTADEAENCHILFISRSEATRVDRILARLRGKSILTVSDLDAFTTRGGMIRFVTEGNRVRFRINTEATEKAGLTLSSKLLRLAERVTPGKS